MKNTGKDSEKYFEDNFPGMVFRMRDKSDLMGLNKGKKLATFGNPSDYIVIDDVGMKFAEVKSSISPTSFSLSGFTPAQKSAISRCHRAGYGDLYLIAIHSLHHGRWYRMNASEYYDLVVNQKRKSIKWEQINTQMSW